MAISPDILRAAIAAAGGARFQAGSDQGDDGSGGSSGGDPDAVSSNQIPADPGRDADQRGEEAALDSIGDLHDRSVDLAPVAPTMPYGPQQVAPSQVQFGHRFQRFGGPGVVRNIDDGFRMMQEANVDAAKAQREATEAQADLLQDTRAQLQEKYAENERQRHADHTLAKQRVGELQNEADRIGKIKIDQGRAFRNPIGFLGAITMALTPLFTKRPTGAAEAISKVINRDVDAQITDIATQKGALSEKRGLFADYMALLKDEDQARLMSEAKMKELAAMKLQEVAARSRSHMIDAQAKQTAAQLMLQANELKMRVYAMAYSMTNLPPQVAAALDASEAGKSYRVGPGNTVTVTDQMGNQTVATPQQAQRAVADGMAVPVSRGPSGPQQAQLPRGTTQAYAGSGQAGQAAQRPGTDGTDMFGFRKWGSGPAPTADQIFGTVQRKPGEPVPWGQETYTADQIFGEDHTPAPKKGAPTGGFPQLGSHPVARAMLTKLMQDNPVTAKGSPSLGPRIQAAREQFMMEQATNYINGEKDPNWDGTYREVQKRSGPAVADASAAGYAMYKANKAVKEAQKNSGEVMKEWTKHAGDAAMITDISDRLNRLVKILGSEEKVEEMFGLFNVVPETREQFFQVAKKMGWQNDKRMEEVADIFTGMQAANLKVRHEYAGVSVNPNEAKNIESFFSKKLSIHSIRQALAAIERDKANTYNAAAGAAGSEYGMLMLVGQNRTTGAGMPRKGIAPSGGKPSPNAHLYE